MLTPLGVGGRRRSGVGRRVLVVVVVLVVLGGAGAAAWWWWTNRDETADVTVDGPRKICTTPSPKQPRDVPPTAQVQVDVRNGTKQPGLAVSTADALATRGFDVVGIGNTTKPVATGVAVVVYQPKALGAAVRVASYLPGASLQAAPRLPAGDVQLRLGPQFDAVSTDAQAKRQRSDVALPAASPTCRRVRPSQSPS